MEGAPEAFSKADVMHTEMRFAVAPQSEAKQEKEHHADQRNGGGGKRETFCQKRDENRIFPARSQAIERGAQGTADDGNARDSEMDRAGVSIVGIVIRNVLKHEFEDFWLGEIVSREEIAIAATRNDVEGWIDDDPLSINSHFGDNVIRGVALG